MSDQSESRTLASSADEPSREQGGRTDDAHAPEDRARREALPADRPRRDQEGLPQVPDPGRADRPPGPPRRLHPPSPDRDPALPLRPARRRAAWARAKASAATAWTARPAPSPATTSSRSRSALDELAAILGEELELPRIQPRGRRSVPVEKVKYSNMRRVGPESLRHFKRTFREALKRQVAPGALRPGAPAHRAHPRGPPLPLLARARGAGEQRRDHPLHGRVAAAWATSRRRSCAWRRSGSTPGCAASTRTSTTCTSCTRPSPRRSTSTPSTTCARAAAPGSPPPTS